jgi:Baseplate J-like protein
MALRDQDPPESPVPPSGQEPVIESLATVVTVDPRDDIASVCGRVDSSPTYAVVVHAPKGNRQLATELGMRRLARHAEDGGRVVAIATRNRGLASRARQVGVPVAARPHLVRWDAGGRRVVRLWRRDLVLPSLGAPAQYLVLGLAALLMVAGAVTAGPSATVALVPPTETLTETLVVTIDKELDRPDIAGLRLPAREISASQRVTLASRTTGKAQVDTKQAKVSLTVGNPGVAEVKMPAGAVVLAAPDSIEFALDAPVIVAAGKSATVAATALKPGAGGNVGAAAISKFKDPAHAALTVTNAAAAAGGASEERAAATEADVLAIRALARDLDRSESLRLAVLKAIPGDAALLRTAKTTLAVGEPSAAPGTPADIIFLEVDVTVSALAVPQSALESLARARLKAGQAAGELVPGSTRAAESGASQLNSEDGTFRTEMRISAEFARGVSAGDVKDAVKGRSVGDAESILRERYGIQDAGVKVTPGWAPWLPRFGFRINVKLNTPPAPLSLATTKTDATTTATAATSSPTAAPGR